MSERLKIQVTDGGPYRVDHVRSVQFCGEPLPVEAGETLWLCRCGHSANAPFCDSTHRKVGIPSEAPRAPKDIVTWEGRTVRTFFNPNTCMHVFKCQPLKALREAELAGDDAAAAEILRVVATCPSGALTAEAKVPLAVTPPELGCDIDIQEGGEIRVQTAFEIDTPLNERQQPERATLCRCGLSRNKPWCDGRHKGRKDFR